MTLILVVSGLVLAGFLIDRLLLWMEWRGWIDYRRTYPGRIDPGRSGRRSSRSRDCSSRTRSTPPRSRLGCARSADALGDGDGYTERDGEPLAHGGVTPAMPRGPRASR